jgi:hypothetical protein
MLPNLFLSRQRQSIVAGGRSRAPPRTCSMTRLATGRSGAGLSRRPFSAFYEQSRGEGSSDGESSAKDSRNVSQRRRSSLVLSHPQVSFDDTQKGTFHASQAHCCFCRQALARRLGTYVVTNYIYTVFNDKASRLHTCGLVNV